VELSTKSFFQKALKKLKSSFVSFILSNVSRNIHDIDSVIITNVPFLVGLTFKNMCFLLRGHRFDSKGIGYEQLCKLSNQTIMYLFPQT
jgi:hypothetical protein